MKGIISGEQVGNAARFDKQFRVLVGRAGGSVSILRSVRMQQFFGDQIVCRHLQEE